MAVGFHEFPVGLLVSDASWFSAELSSSSVYFFQIFLQKNLKNFGRGVLKMVWFPQVSRRFELVLMPSRFTLNFHPSRFTSSNFFEKKI